MQTAARGAAVRGCHDLVNRVRPLGEVKKDLVDLIPWVE